jgi:hypothetical protein
VFGGHKEAQSAERGTVLNLFKRKPTADALVERLRPAYAEVSRAMVSVEGPFLDLYECGVFVACVATLKILTFKTVDPTAFADTFNAKWVDYLVSSYMVDGRPPDKRQIIARLQEKYPHYRSLVVDLLNVISSRNTEALDKASVQLAWELFANCTRRPRPDGGAFLNLVVASGTLAGITEQIVQIVQE